MNNTNKHFMDMSMDTLSWKVSPFFIFGILLEIIITKISFHFKFGINLHGRSYIDMFSNKCMDNPFGNSQLNSFENTVKPYF